MKQTLSAGLLLMASGLLLTGCQTTSAPLASSASKPAVMKSHLTAVDGSQQVHGQLLLRPVNDGVQIYGKLVNLKPGSTVALHIHETGSCADGGKGAGGHFNPTNQPHGHPDSSTSHAGDLPNVTADANGIAEVNYVNHKISAAMAGTNSVYRRAFIIHAGADDYRSQPSGASGDRIACGIIEKN